MERPILRTSTSNSFPDRTARPALSGVLASRLTLERRCLRVRLLGGLALAVALAAYAADASQGSLGMGGGLDTALRAFLVLAPLAAPILPALSVGAERELGLVRERALDGVRPGDLSYATALSAGAIAGAVVIGALVAATLVGGLDGLVRDSQPGQGVALVDALQDAGRVLVIALPAWTLLGAAIGALTGSRFGAAGWTLGVAVAFILLERASFELPALASPYAMTPAGAIDVALGDFDPSLGEPLSEPLVIDALIVAWLGFAILAVRAVGVRQTRPRSPRFGRRRLSSRWTLVPAGAALALAFGWVVPTALRTAVPWYLRPQWLVDKANDQASDDVTRRYLALVGSGRDAEASRLTEDGEAAAALGPFRSGLVPPPVYLDVRVRESQDATPGTVTVDAGPSSEQARQYTACLVRRPSGWRVLRFVSNGVCE